MAPTTSRALPLGLWLSSLAVATPIAQLAGGVDAVLALSPLRCPLMLLAGMPCPTCGLGHALVHAWTFDLSQAWAHHPLGALLLPLSGGLCALWMVGPGRVRGLGRALDMHVLRSPVALLVGVLAYVTWGIARFG